ncbi:hypothetical protein L1887_21872 [Cichorium endivia]|nr:hypothetical protein L1887_21872 [Cichorium endivia]
MKISWSKCFLVFNQAYLGLISVGTDGDDGAGQNKQISANTGSADTFVKALLLQQQLLLSTSLGGGGDSGIFQNHVADAPLFKSLILRFKRFLMELIQNLLETRVAKENPVNKLSIKKLVGELAIELRNTVGAVMRKKAKKTRQSPIPIHMKPFSTFPRK